LGGVPRARLLQERGRYRRGAPGRPADGGGGGSSDPRPRRGLVAGGGGVLPLGPAFAAAFSLTTGDGNSSRGQIVVVVSAENGLRRSAERVKRPSRAGETFAARRHGAGLSPTTFCRLSRRRRHSSLIKLIEEAIIVSRVAIVFLFHFLSALVAVLTLPLAVRWHFWPCWGSKN